MNENMENRSELLVKWLRVLMYIAIVSLVNSVVNFLPFVPAAVTTWVSRGIMVAVVVCMFQLTPANERYKKAGNDCKDGNICGNACKDSPKFRTTIGGNHILAKRSTRLLT